MLFVDATVFMETLEQETFFPQGGEGEGADGHGGVRLRASMSADDERSECVRGLLRGEQRSAVVSAT